MTLQDKIKSFLERDFVRNGIIGVIMFNAIILGLETSKTVMDNAGGLIKALDILCLSIFVAELVAKLFVYRLAFFRDGWNMCSTFVIVGIALDACAGQGLLGVACLADFARFAGDFSRPAFAPRCGGFRHCLARYGVRILVDGVDFLHRLSDRHQTVCRYLSPVVWQLGSVRLFPVPDHDAGKLVYGHRATRDGSVSAGMDILYPVYHGDHLCGCEPVGRFDRKLDAGCARRGIQRRNRRLPRRNDSAFGIA